MCIEGGSEVGFAGGGGVGVDDGGGGVVVGRSVCWVFDGCSFCSALGGEDGVGDVLSGPVLLGSDSGSGSGSTSSSSIIFWRISLACSSSV